MPKSEEQGTSLEEGEKSKGAVVPSDLVDVNDISTSLVTFRVPDNILALSVQHGIEVC